MVEGMSVACEIRAQGRDESGTISKQTGKDYKSYVETESARQRNSDDAFNTGASAPRGVAEHV